MQRAIDCRITYEPAQTFETLVRLQRLTSPRDHALVTMIILRRGCSIMAQAVPLPYEALTLWRSHRDVPQSRRSCGSSVAQPRLPSCR